MIFHVSALTVAVIMVFNSIQEVSSSPRGRGGGGGRVGGIRGGGSRYGGGSYRPKSGSSTKSFSAIHGKSAAAFGAGAYVGHKISSVVGTTHF